MEWYEVNAPAQGRQGQHHWVAPDVYDASVAPITMAQFQAFGTIYSSGGPYKDANDAANHWFAAMASAIPQLAARLDLAEKVNLFNLISTSVAFNPASPWRDPNYALTALNGYLSNPTTLSNVMAAWVYEYTGGDLRRSRVGNWTCDAGAVNAWCAGGIGNSIAQCACVGCCYDVQYARLPESIPALDSWGDSAGIHSPGGVWICPTQGWTGNTGCGNPVAPCDGNHPCNAGYTCVTIGQGGLPAAISTACIIDTANPPACNGIGTACSGDTQCCSGLNCQGGNCQVPLPSCNGPAECSLGFVCVNGTCEPVGPGNCYASGAICANTVQCCAGMVCNAGSDGVGHCMTPPPPGPCGGVTCPSGYHCSNNICVPDNVDPCQGVTCPSGYHCDNGNCIPDNSGCNSTTCLPPNTCQNNVCTPPGQGCDSTNCVPPNYCANGKCVAVGGGSNALLLVLGILGVVGVGAAIAVSSDQSGGSYY